ncbi:MAG: phage portal protein, partial [Atopobiaceae bacterium]|nr:phage portal protein [Atopobiaceae bacterium]
RKDDDGDVPQFGQLTQGSMQPHIDYMRSLAARFSGETNVPVSELGIVQDNPSSAEAIYAAKEPLVIEAQNLNADNGEALRNVALMALAIHEGTDFRTELARGLTIQPKFRNPAMPSIVSQADAMTKMISALPWLADSDVALEEFGFTDEQIQRLRSDRKRSQASQLIAQTAIGS